MSSDAVAEAATGGQHDEASGLPMLGPSAEGAAGEAPGGGGGARRRLLGCADCLISALLVGPLVVAHWRSSWLLMDLLGGTFDGWACLGAGLGLHALFVLGRQPLHERLGGEPRGRGARARWLALRGARAAYTYLFGQACCGQWRGIWQLLDGWFEREVGLLAGCCTCALLGNLLLLRCARNLLTAPFLVGLDSAPLVFRFPTRYRLSARRRGLYALDCAFSVGVVGSLVVFVWRGAWALLDLYLFPESRERSAHGSLVAGYALVGLAFGAQPWARRACARLRGPARLLAADGFLLLSFLGTVNVWRGIWMGLDLYLLPQSPQASCWITHLGCFGLLLLLNCSNSILVRGVYIDGEEPGGQCVDFPCRYLRHFFQEERQRKEAEEAAAAEAGAKKEVENGALLAGRPEAPA